MGGWGKELVGGRDGVSGWEAVGISLLPPTHSPSAAVFPTAMVLGVGG